MLQKAEPDWIEKVKATHKFHVARLKEDKKWTLKKTAKVLNRSIGSISQDLMACHWLRTHYDKLVKFDYLHEALEFIRERKQALLIEEVDFD